MHLDPVLKSFVGSLLRNWPNFFPAERQLFQEHSHEIGARSYLLVVLSIPSLDSLLIAADDSLQPPVVFSQNDHQLSESSRRLIFFQLNKLLYRFLESSSFLSEILDRALSHHFLNRSPDSGQGRIY